MKQEDKVLLKSDYSRPIFVEYGKVEELTKGDMMSGIPEGVEPWTSYQDE